MPTARIRITLKPTVLDAQGAVVARALRDLGFEEVEAVRMGKYIEVEVGEREDARSRVEAMCRQLLANPVIEEYRVEME